MPQLRNKLKDSKKLINYTREILLLKIQVRLQKFLENISKPRKCPFHEGIWTDLILELNFNTLEC